MLRLEVVGSPEITSSQQIGIRARGCPYEPLIGRLSARQVYTLRWRPISALAEGRIAARGLRCLKPRAGIGLPVAEPVFVSEHNYRWNQ